MRKYIYTTVILLAAFLSSQSALADHQYSDTGEHYQSHIEVYGHAGFLMRLDSRQKFGVSVHNHTEAECVIDDQSLRENLEKKMRENGRNVVDASAQPPFMLHLEVIGGLDKHDHCLLSYDLSLLHNYTDETPGQKHINQEYDYMNSAHLLKLIGLLHVMPQEAAAKLNEQANIGSERILDNLVNIQKIYANPPKN